MARKIPVISWTVKHRPRIEPKFHQIDRLTGAGRFRRLFLRENRSGWGVFRELGIVSGRKWS